MFGCSKAISCSGGLQPGTYTILLGRPTPTKCKGQAIGLPLRNNPKPRGLQARVTSYFDTLYVADVEWLIDPDVAVTVT